MRKRVLMILSNPYRPDPRVQREIEGLVDAGYLVSLIAWDRKAELKASETSSGFEIHRVQDIQTVYGAGWRQLFYLPRFWRKAVRIGQSLDPDVVHCHDLDTLWTGVRLKKMTGCRLVYDAHEHYPAMMSLYLPGMMVKTLARWEKRLIQSADVTITASTVLGDLYREEGISPVTTIGNYPQFERFSSVDPEEVQTVRRSLNEGGNNLLIGYIAGLSRNRMILPLIESAALLPEVQYHVWGDGAQREAVESAAAGQQNVHYHGWLPFDQLPVHFHALDIIYYGLRVDYPGAVFNAPNTLTQSMASGRPIIASNVGDLGRIVKDSECGYLLSNVTPEAIAEAIVVLSDKQVREKMAENGRRAAKSKYNAAAAQEELVKQYADLPSRSDRVS